MRGRLAIGLTVVIAAATCQTSSAEDAVEGTVVDQGADEAETARGSALPGEGGLVGDPYVLRARRAVPGDGVHFSVDPRSVDSTSLFRLPAGEFTLRLSQPWALRDPLQQGPSSLLETLRATPSVHLEYPLSGSTSVGLGVTPGASAAPTGGVYLRLSLGSGAWLSAGLESPAEMSPAARSRARIGSSFSIEF